MPRFGLEVRDTLPPRNRDVIPVLVDLFKRLEIENGAGITLLTVPKGLSLESVDESARDPLKGNSTNIRYCLDDVREQLGCEKVGNTYYVLITEGLINGSREKSVEEQKALVEEKGCVVPTCLSLVTLNLLTYITTFEPDPPRLYTSLDNDRYYTISRSVETIKNYDGLDCTVSVGNYDPEGLLVTHVHHCFDCNAVGVAAMWKF